MVCMATGVQALDSGPVSRRTFLSAVPKHFLALAMASRQIRIETWPVVFAVNDWLIMPERAVKEGPQDFRDWLDCLDWLGPRSEK